MLCGDSGRSKVRLPLRHFTRTHPECWLRNVSQIMPLLLKTLQWHPVAARMKCGCLTLCSQHSRTSLLLRPHQPLLPACALDPLIFLFLDYRALGPSNWPGVCFLNIVTGLTASYHVNISFSVISLNTFDLRSAAASQSFSTTSLCFSHSASHYMILCVCLSSPDNNLYNLRILVCLIKHYCQCLVDSTCLISVSR